MRYCIMLYDLRNFQIHNQFEKNMFFYCDKNYKLKIFSFDGIPFPIQEYIYLDDSIHLFSCEHELIVPLNLTIYRY